MLSHTQAHTQLTCMPNFSLLGQKLWLQNFWKKCSKQTDRVRTWTRFYCLEGAGELDHTDDPPMSANCWDWPQTATIILIINIYLYSTYLDRNIHQSTPDSFKEYPSNLPVINGKYRTQCVINAWFYRFGAIRCFMANMCNSKRLGHLNLNLKVLWCTLQPNWPLWLT